MGWVEDFSGAPFGGSALSKQHILAREGVKW